MSFEPLAPKPQVDAELPAWARRLPMHVGVTLFIFFVGGFWLLEWLGRSRRVEVLIPWALVLLIGSVITWMVLLRRDRDRAT